MQVPIGSEKEFNRFSIAIQDFMKVIKFLNESKKHLENSLVYEALLISAIIYYYRPFSPNEKNQSAAADPSISIDSFSKLTLEEKALHERCKILRNKAVAHAEWSFYPTGLCPETGVVVSRPYSIVSESIDLNALRSVAEKLRIACLHLRADYKNVWRREKKRGVRPPRPVAQITARNNLKLVLTI